MLFCVILRSSWLSAVQDPLGLPQKTCLFEIGDKLTTLISFAQCFAVGFFFVGSTVQEWDFCLLSRIFSGNKRVLLPQCPDSWFSMCSLFISGILFWCLFLLLLDCIQTAPIRGQVTSLLQFWEPKSSMGCRLLEPW